MIRKLFSNRIHECLDLYQEEVLVRWKDLLKGQETFLLFCANRNFKDSLQKYLDEVLAAILRKPLLTPTLPDPCPETVEYGLSIILKGRKAVVATLKDHLSISEKEWPTIRKIINQSFHSVLRKNSKSSCDLCRAHLDDQSARLRELNASLEKKLSSDDR